MTERWPIMCISLWQPYATLMACGAKSMETRSWSTRYRGPLAIHAAKRWTKEQRDLCRTQPFRSTLAAAGFRDPDDLPLGAIVALVDVAHVWSTDNRWAVEAVSYPESAFGDFSPGRYAWFCERIRPLSQPIPFRARQGLFEIDGRPVIDALIRRDRASRALRTPPTTLFTAHHDR